MGKALDPALLNTFFNLDVVRSLAFGESSASNNPIEIAS
jgi:hypothetical protein